ncbi:MAG: polysaccharide deacetylase family protein [Clostridia bacterium]
MLIIKKNYLIYIIILLISMLITSVITSKIVKIQTEKNIFSPEKDSFCSDKESTKNYEEFLMQKYIEKKLIALTFDDGPSRYTESLVDELTKRNIHCTFFVIGKNIETMSSHMKFAYDSGNEIAIHTYTHKLFTSLKKEEIESEIKKTRDLIFNSIQKEPTLIRVPYGAINKKVEDVINYSSLKSILWTVDSKDWKFKNVDRIYNYVLKNIKGNDIILMHDAYKTSIDSAIKIIDTLTEKCYTFVTVSEFLNIKEKCTNQETKKAN